MFKNILLAVDGSEHALKAARVASDLARSQGSTLRVISAFEPISGLIGEPDRQRIVTAHISEAERALQAAVDEIGEFSGELKTEVLEGPASEAILNVVDTRGCDLIVMGTRGQGRFKGLLMGSQSQKVVSHANCPVMLVR